MTRISKTSAALIVGMALTPAAWAQFGGGPAAPMHMGSPQGSSPLGGGRLPFASGTVTVVNAAAGTITLTSALGGGQPQTVRVTDATLITATQAGTVGDLKVGDTIQVRGVPAAIAATQITADNGTDRPAPGAGAPSAGRRFGPRIGPGPGSMGPGMSGGMPGPQPAFAQATGRITGLNPLTIAVSDEVQVTLRAAPDMKISRNVSEKIGDLKPGDRVMAGGRVGDDGVLEAARLRVNADFGLGFGMTPAPR